MKKTYIALGVVVLLVVAFFGANFYICSQTERGLKDSFNNGGVFYDEVTCKSMFFNPTCVATNLTTQGVNFGKLTARNVGTLKNFANGKDGKSSFDFLFEDISMDLQNANPSAPAKQYEALNEAFANSNFSMVIKSDFETKNGNIVLVDPFVIKMQSKDIEFSIKVKADEPNGVMKNPMMANFNYLNFDIHVKNRDALIDTLQKVYSQTEPNRTFTKKEIKEDMSNFRAQEVLNPKNEKEKEFASALDNLIQGKSDSLSVEIEGNNLVSGFMMFKATKTLPPQYKITIKN